MKNKLIFMVSALLITNIHIYAQYNNRVYDNRLILPPTIGTGIATSNRVVDPYAVDPYAQVNRSEINRDRDLMRQAERDQRRYTERTQLRAANRTNVAPVVAQTNLAPVVAQDKESRLQRINQEIARLEADLS